MEKQNNPITQEELKQIFCVADENNDGLLSFREFLLFCQKINLKSIPDGEQRGPGLMNMNESSNRRPSCDNDKRSVDNHNGQGSSPKYFPPGQYLEHRRPPESGVRKIHAAIQPHVEEPKKVNFAGAVAFFENEVGILYI